MELCLLLRLFFFRLLRLKRFSTFFFFNDTATTEIYTLSLHDALPICSGPGRARTTARRAGRWPAPPIPYLCRSRSEEHTSELQSQSNLVCRLLLEKKKIVPLHDIMFTHALV